MHHCIGRDRPLGSDRTRVRPAGSELEVDERGDALGAEGVDQDEADGEGADLQDRRQLGERDLGTCAGTRSGTNCDASMADDR